MFASTYDDSMLSKQQKINVLHTESLLNSEYIEERMKIAEHGVHLGSQVRKENPCSKFSHKTNTQVVSEMCIRAWSHSPVLVHHPSGGS